MKKVIVLGSLNMDLSIQCDSMPKNGETLNGFDFFTNPGGKGGNQAVACAKLGASTHMIANVGQDVFGNEILEKLKEYGVHTDEIKVSKFDASGVAVIIRCNHDNRIILCNGANHTLDKTYVFDTLNKIANYEDIFLTQLENDYDLVKDAIIHAKSKGLFTILNPAPARALDDSIYQNLDLIIINQTECQMLTGIYPVDEESSNKALSVFDKKNVKAIITLGIHGSITNFYEKSIFVSSIKVETVDTTAAGDSYIGALCSCLARNIDIKDALTYASKVAALTVTRKGAQVSIPYKQEVEKYFRR
ncbi:MAG: ribokinase [Longicatena sp.]